MNYDNTSVPTNTDSAGVFNVSMTTVTSPQSSASAGETESWRRSAVWSARWLRSTYLIDTGPG